LHRQACEKYEPGTGDWVLRSDDWKSWLSGQQRSLWIHGIPGAGKTVLAGHLISHLIEQVKTEEKEMPPKRKVACLYYYCYFGHNQNEAPPFIKWAIGRLSRDAKLVPPLLYELWQDDSEPSLADLLRVLEELIRGYDRIYIVVDAVDESNERHDLLRILRDLATDFRFQNVSILATSREYTDIEDVLLNFSARISMRNPLLDQDIKRYVESELRRHPTMSTWPADIQHEVLEALSAKANGM
jgi:Cdc6-like AAA superfamily ATPase